jgi:preprotein translocase subunit SecB
MAEDGTVTTQINQDGSAPNGEDTGPAAGILSQYVKDLSVENPNAPLCFQWADQPQIEVQFNIQANAIETELHEVELKIELSSKCEAGTQFLIELAYCGLVGIRGFTPEQQHMFIYAEAQRILFPFARRVIADAVRDAGYPPFMLEPIDFNGLYLQQLAAQQQAQGEPAGNA